MGLVSCVNLFISANVLLVLVAGVLAGIGLLSACLHHPLSYRQQLRLGQAVTLAAILLPVMGLMVGHRSGFAPTAQVWFAGTMQSSQPLNADDALAGIVAVSSGKSVSLERALQIAGGLLLAGALGVALRVASDLRLTLRLLRKAHHVRRQGRLHILASERLEVPFSFWLPLRSIVVVPSALVSRWDDLRLVMHQETQHHRQLDAMLLYLLAALKAVFFWNPAIHWLDSRLRALQEFACDEALRLSGRISCREYCECLLRVAEAAISPRRPSSTVVSMAGDVTDMLLRRRIEALLEPPGRPMNKPAFTVIGIAVVTLMAGTVFAFSPSVQDRRISADVAAQMVTKARQDTIFPIASNERVLRQLNLWLATPDGRVALREALRRMRRHAPGIAAQLEQRHLPSELMAVPLVESGYRNRPQGIDPRQGAGLWMVIKPTAVRLGLKVTPDRDERLDEQVETEMALRLLERCIDNSMTGNWRCSVTTSGTNGSPMPCKKRHRTLPGR